ncbi:MAG TPA: sigma-70 family RNA polymerase sigma factor [Bryobacteraceae bacterium]|nr:sigma-70 family RNA polymerase sigma factor [Bryobacteraceae bacterium]
MQLSGRPEPRPVSTLQLMDSTDRECVEAVLNGDRDAYRDLVFRYSGIVFRAARRITGNDADAEEVVQDTFLRGYLQIRNFELRADFGTWIYRIGVNCSIDLLRKRKRQPGPAGDALPRAVDTAAGPERLLLSAELDWKRRTAMARLTEVEAAAFSLRHMEDRSMNEVAELLAISLGSAKQAVFRAVQKLRREMAPLKVKQ